MQCPVCKTRDLVMSERQGIEIDYCPQCRGVWLDRGELDKIIERSADDLAPAPQTQPQHSAPPPGRDSYGYGQSHGYGQAQHGYYKKKKRKSILSEIFDF